ncbi:bifunctional DNA primase/polymerase [Lactobacillus selangorensis]|nr:bifunctional DNA primase/polymerase [Lactobacillus selangorensis]
MKNLVNYAVSYAQHGFSVLPMIGKKPLIKFADQPPLTVDEIENLWKKKPYASIALRTTNFFVVDIDRHEDGADGFKSLKEYNHPEQFKKTLAQKTAGGGKQLFYMKDGDIVQQNIGWLPGVDIKAHINNYVVVAPSENHGKQYKWLNHEPIVKPSSELITAINKRSESDYTPTAYSHSEGHSATAELFEKIVNGLGATGGRNNALASFVGGLLFRDVGAEEVYRLALIANNNTESPLPENEVNRTFESMLKKEMRRREAEN